MINHSTLNLHSRVAVEGYAHMVDKLVEKLSARA
jgi:hypothetical protein